MNILFIGSMIPKEISYQIEHNSEAGNNFQWNVIEQLKKNNNVELLSYLGYRTTKILQIEKLCKKLKITSFFKQKGFLKSMYLNFHSSLKFIKNCDISIQYNISYANIYIPIIAHLFNKKAYLILADYTESIEYNNIIKKIYAKLMLTSMKKFDEIICLSSKMASRMKKEGKNTIVIEGGININEFENIVLPVPVSNESIILLYSGLLSQVTGVDRLLNAIKKNDMSNIEFWFTGKGELQQLVEEYEKKDKRIKYLGFIERDEYLNLLNKSHILINPRNMDMPQNKNNFPSKIMEYIASGRVIISTKFPGYEKFKDNIIFSGNSENELSITINYAINNYNKILKKYYEINRIKAISFDWNKQINKIIKSIED
ncbi:glycosyltransferase [Clostridium sp. Ade.TY]|uniref:glycosyltransferase n=1 Tax=Clostridium sp. Ade.TY TaxID=1391647 RepID=UPI000400ACAD|nr:glycosyltransferase [Clostridium sp. Ade.TY]